MVDIRFIQSQIDSISKNFKQYTNHQIALKIVNSSRKGDPAFSEACRKAAENRKDGGCRYFTDEHREKLSKTQHKKRAVVTPVGEFESGVAFRKKTGYQFNDRRLAMPHLYYYKDEGPSEPTYENVGYTPHGVIPLAYGKKAEQYGLLNITKVHEMAKAAGEKMALNHKHAGDWFATVCKYDPDNYYKKREVKREWILKGE